MNYSDLVEEGGMSKEDFMGLSREDLLEAVLVDMSLRFFSLLERHRVECLGQDEPGTPIGQVPKEALPFDESKFKECPCDSGEHIFDCLCVEGVSNLPFLL